MASIPGNQPLTYLERRYLYVYLGSEGAYATCVRHCIGYEDCRIWRGQDTTAEPFNCSHWPHGRTVAPAADPAPELRPAARNLNEYALRLALLAVALLLAGVVLAEALARAGVAL